MKRLWWLVAAAILAAMMLSLSLTRSKAKAAPPPPDPPGLIAFYPKAAERVERPPSESALRAFADWTAEDGSHVTLVSAGKKRAFLAVFTPDKMKKPDQALFLRPRYVVAKDMKAVAAGREPLVRTTAGALDSWAYVYDRNGDGRADYLTYLAGPMAVQDDSFPADYPRDGEPLTQAQLDYSLDRQRYVFTHAADEDYNGAIDALVLYVRDPDRAWVREFAALLAWGGASPDSAWTFRRSIAEPTGALPEVDGGYLRHRVANRPVYVTAANYDTWTAVLTKINAAAEATKTRFPPAP